MEVVSFQWIAGVGVTVFMFVLGGYIRSVDKKHDKLDSKIELQETAHNTLQLNTQKEIGGLRLEMEKGFNGVKDLIIKYNGKK